MTSSAPSQGNSAFFYVLATGTAPLSFQWFKNSEAIPGATDWTYITPPTTLADENAQFTVSVTNNAASVISNSAKLDVISAQYYGLGGIQPLTTLPSIYPGNPADLIGARFRLQVVTNQDVGGKLIFGGVGLYTPGQAILGYGVESNVYSWTVNFTNGGCTTYPPIGRILSSQASLRNATADYPYTGGQQPAVGSAINTSEPVNWPVQTYLVDNIPKLWKSDSISQFSMNGLETLVTIQRGNTLTDISGFERCGLPMLSTTYRMWTITTQVTGYPAVVNQIIAPDAAAKYIRPDRLNQTFSEFLGNPGGAFTVQYWDFAFMTESNPMWTPITTFTTMYPYDGDGTAFGEHVVSVNGQDRIEFSNVPGNSYLPGNLPFAIAPP